MTKQELMKQVLEVMQQAEELGGLETDDYIQFMDELGDIARKRAHNARVAKSYPSGE